MRRKISNEFLALILLFLLPTLVLAATNDFTANGNVTVSAVTFGAGTADMLIISGSTAESWSFSSGSFTVTNPGTFNVGSSDSAVKSIQFSSGGTTLVCAENTTPGTSYATAPTSAGTYTITPSATTQCTNLCSAVANAASYNSFPTCGAASCNAGYRLSGSSGSATCIPIGGGGVFMPCGPGYTFSKGSCYQSVSDAVTDSIPSPQGGQTGTQPLPLALFTATMSMGSQNSDVYRLQKLLASDSSLYPEALVTGYYGSLTRAAIGRFQLKYTIIASPDEPGYGVVGPKTRLKLQEIFGVNAPAQSVETVPSDLSTIFSKTLRLGVMDEEVRQLQRFLNVDPDTRLAEVGVGSPGNESTFFGSLTEAAVQKFQTKHNIVLSGTPETTGYGIVGAKTRAKLNALSTQ